MLGRHTGENIKTKFLDVVVGEYGIRDKVRYVLTDNAANMKKAFSTGFGSAVWNTPAVDEPDMWETHEEMEQQLENALSVSDNIVRLSCFAHSLQLVVHDGIKGNKL